MARVNFEWRVDEHGPSVTPGPAVGRAASTGMTRVSGPPIVAAGVGSAALMLAVVQPAERMSRAGFRHTRAVAGP